MKSYIPVLLLFFGVIGLWFFGNATWILAIINLAWMLFKDHQLFSWTWFIWSAVGFAVSGVMAIIGMMFE